MRRKGVMGGVQCKKDLSATVEAARLGIDLSVLKLEVETFFWTDPGRGRGPKHCPKSKTR